MSDVTFLAAASSTPDATALIWNEDGDWSTGKFQDMTWAQLERRVRQFANGLRALGIDRGERVAVLSLNRPEWVVALAGNHLGGTRHVPMNWHLSAEEVEYILSDSRARLLVVDPEHEEVGRSAAIAAGVEHVIVTGDDFWTWLDAQADDIELDGPAGGLLLYTSGTTGRQKGVMRSDQSPAVASIMEHYERLAGAWRMTPGGVHLVACPMYHATPQAMSMFCLSLGQAMVLMPSFDAETALALIERHRVTSTHLVPTQLVRLLRLDPEVRARYDVSSLNGVWHGAAPCPEWVKRASIEWLGPIVIEYFGSSEGTGPLIATSQEWLDHPGTVGKPAAFLTVTAVDEDGHDLPQGEVGTLYFERPEGPPTYQGAPEKTAAMQLTDGRFTVGDVGWIDEEGFVYLADRKIDMIISGGANIYPSEIESVLSEHPAVSDCAVFGIPDDEWGEQVKAAVQLVPGAEATATDLIAWCRSRIAGFKCPRSIDFHSALPREASGKMKKRLLRDAYWVSSGRKV